MSISAELEAKILRYYHVEKWRVGTIARQLQVHHGTVQRVLRRAGVPPAQSTARASKADPYVPFILQPGVMTMAWGSVVRQLAAGLDVELDEVEEWYERLPATESFEVDAGTIEKGTAAALHFEVRGIRHGRAVIVLEHVTRLHDDLGPGWPQPAGHGCYRVQVTGEPNYTLDLQLLGSDGDHNTAGLKATAMRLVNAVPAVVEGPAGLLTALDLPPVTGRGLVTG